MEKLSRFKPYLMMLALIAGLTGLRLLLLPIMKYVGPVAVYFLATAIAALYGGLRLALFTCVVCVMVAVYFFIPPLHSLEIDSPADRALIMIFIVDALVFGVAGEIFKRARDRKNELMHSLEHARRHMELNQHTVRAMLESSSQGIFGISIDGTIRIANQTAHRMFGYEPDELLGKPIDVLIDMQQRAAHARHLREFFAASGEPMMKHGLDLQGRCKNGELIPIEAAITITDTAEGRMGVSFVSDVTERKRAEEKLRHAAQHDPLTGLPNRALVYEIGAQLIGGARRHQHKLAVMFFDLDRFKPVNDTYGHRTGDLMLQEVAHRLKTSVRSSDLVGRLGGDEFVAVLTELHSDAHLESIASHLLKRLSEPYRIESLELHTSPSIGISLYTDDGNDIDLLIRRADAAMYHAKSRGRNNYQYFSDEIRSNTANVFALEQRLRRSLHDDDFELAYQPVIDMRSGKLSAVEALIRWRQPDGAELMPGDFIAAAEASGLIHQLGEWVIREACRQHEQWRQAGLPEVRIAVNVSPIQFRAPEFRDRLLAALASSTMSPSCLELEVTETTVMSRIEEATRTMAWLKELGLRVALDDFGTGYSSLSHLAQLPIDKLKVDKAFVTHIDTDLRSLAITETVLALGQKLGVETVAEGIENPGAFSMLRDLGCGLAQGYLIGRPMGPDQLRDWHQARESEMRVMPA
ncbi:MAG: hypothetical protein RL404_899 [Pseudomonadota bacterium]|jgi:diguanylate cyclase (GGDEF)-like protein/PAS domain S-box-containing protein